MDVIDNRRFAAGYSNPQVYPETGTFRHASLEKAAHALRIGDAVELTCCCLHKRGWIRRTLFSTLGWSGTDALVTLSIILNTIALCLFDPLSPSANNPWSAVNTISTVCTIVFTLELLMRVTAFGFIGGPSAYLSDAWNWLDAAIVALGWAALSPAVGQLTSLRLLRIVRWMSRYPGVRVVLTTCYKALPGLFGVMALSVGELQAAQNG